MKRRVIVDGTTVEAELLSDGRVRIGDRAESISLMHAGRGRLSLLLGRNSYVVRPNGNHLFVGSRRLEVSIVDPRAFVRGARHRLAEGNQSIVAPMPGRVVRILKVAGAPVEPGDGIVVVEAMKMQNELKATQAGTVASISAAEGDTVAAGQVLAIIEQTDE